MTVEGFYIRAVAVATQLTIGSMLSWNAYVLWDAGRTMLSIGTMLLVFFGALFISMGIACMVEFYMTYMGKWILSNTANDTAECTVITRLRKESRHGNRK